jgi:hypothetical protein
MSETIFPKCKKSKTNGTNGWILNWTFLISVQKDCAIYEDHCDLEEIENVLLSPTVEKEIKRHYEKLEQENKMMREEIKSIHDFAKVLIENNISVDITDFIDIKKDTEKVLNKLTKDKE